MLTDRRRRLGWRSKCPAIAVYRPEGCRDGSTRVRVVPAGFDLQALTAHVRTNIDRLLGPGQVVSACVVDAIPRTATGKLRSPVIDPDDFVPTSTS
jgi:hypothetical protein